MKKRIITTITSILCVAALMLGLCSCGIVKKSVGIAKRVGEAFGGRTESTTEEGITKAERTTEAEKDTEADTKKEQTTENTEEETSEAETDEVETTADDTDSDGESTASEKYEIPEYATYINYEFGFGIELDEDWYIAGGDGAVSNQGDEDAELVAYYEDDEGSYIYFVLYICDAEDESASEIVSATVDYYVDELDMTESGTYQLGDLSWEMAYVNDQYSYGSMLLPRGDDGAWAELYIECADFVLESFVDAVLFPVDVASRETYFDTTIVDMDVYSDENVGSEEPENGAILSGREYFTESYVTVIAASTPNVVKLKDEDGNDVLSFYVRANETATVYVPYETMYVYFATGTTWYGPDELFGEDTAYSRDETPTDFSTYTMTYTLYEVENGNFSPDEIDPEDF